MDRSNARGRDSKLNFWQEHIAGWKASGLSQLVYCRNNNLAVATFGYWRRKLKLQSGEVDKPRFYPLAVAPSQQTIPPHKDGKPFRLLLGGHRFVIEIDNEFSSSTLQHIVRALEQI
ncbi:IS66 family insertion sequence element accessory protein TnpA [Desulfobulbus rhabdoformis]|uniref:IS66 family insertion sequence element accessory protein TnpA n=1 Tax=Desulfobulbus rhabdoformis TaxID=34032 RepID=UPI003B82E5B8